MSDAHRLNPGLPQMAPELPQYWHFSRLRGSCKTQISLTVAAGSSNSDIFPIEDTARLMQGFISERSFTKDRPSHRRTHRSALMVCGTPDQCCDRSRISSS